MTASAPMTTLPRTSKYTISSINIKRVRKHGSAAQMAKFDAESAYKNIAVLLCREM